MKRSLVLAFLAVLAMSLSVPASTAQAGFFTDVAKGTVKNNIRHSKIVIKRAAGRASTMGACALRRLKGEPC